MTADVLALLTAAAARYNVPAALAIRVANQESGGNQYNPDGSLKTSPAGAIGVMQLMPGTAAQLGVDPADTAENIDGGVRYLGQMLAQFGGDPQLALAAYNWGPGNVSKHGFSNWPAETANYVSSILRSAGSALASVETVVTGTISPPDAGPGPGSGGNLIVVAIAGLLALWWAASEVFG
jgi:soluble lytic murein transglycosylase-like protein